ncbi:MAG TPA: alkaline phosphatase family protein [Steroidobacteraceae bacterium]|nr:alkaline phosphatase family protein [Steroidobacteraceae bacterium]
MNVRGVISHALHSVRTAAASLAILQMSVGPVLAAASALPPGDIPSPGTLGQPVSPIKHVIVIIGENRSFDHVFATYKPQPGQTVYNLLSEGIITLDADKNAVPGPNFAKAQQLAASDQGPTDSFLLSPPKQEFPSNTLPAPLTGGAAGPEGYFTPSTACASATGSAAAACQAEAVSLAKETETGLPADTAADASDANGLTYYGSLASGGTLQPSHVPDARITHVTSLPAGPFQLTNSTTYSSPTSFAYTDYAQSPVHRFYQMWQQLNCSVDHVSWDNPSGCNAQLFSWVEVTVGAGTDGTTQPASFSTNYAPGATTTGEGSTALGFYNVQQGDAPYFTYLADNYAMSDNFHQSVNGGTGANHIMLGHGDAIWFSLPNPKDPAHNLPAVPPSNVAYATNPAGYGGVVSEIENPNPAKGTNNWYTEDGYGTDYNEGYPASAWATAEQNGGPVIYGGGSYSDCADPSQPGVKPILDYLAALHIDPHCEPGHYYLLNNYNPGYFGNGNNAYTDHNPSNTPFTIPPSTVPSIGDSLIAADISWKYYGDQWNAYVPDPYDLNYGVPGPTSDEYCNICNPFQYDTSIMANSTVRQEHIQDTVDLYADISNGTLPAVSFVKPSGLVDGHPSSSKLDLFEGFVRKIVDQVEASPEYAGNTAIFITEDEGGGYYDSGYVQPLDFFGDGTRIPLIVVAPKQYLPAKGYISHQYADHVSILKFIERNWGLKPVTHRSRDNFPNPVQLPGSYAPVNTPALGDLFDLFRFPAAPGRPFP